ncbi:carbohydrate sulfotransferase 15-like [Babylonia areolata]|uniref:carbohydrate sulfotransferase 15-like n=1 Tax=Babylonia areolata TaxID=304850 RepID=UPI003FD1E408
MAGQNESEQQKRFGFEPRRGRQKAEVKVHNSSQSWLTDMEYPQWYLESVTRSKVHGKEEEFVGGAPLFEGPCRDAKVKAKEVHTFSYVEPGPFIPGSKNPCWYMDSKLKKELRCLPYFYLVGQGKCGTTDMFARIGFHPDMIQGRLKEYHWWERTRYYKKPVSLAEYSHSLLDLEEDGLKAELRSKNHSEKICGDGTPSYLCDPKEWTALEGNEGCDEPRLLPGSLIQHANPKSKILIIFRHPTQRLYSWYRMWKDLREHPLKVTARNFHDAVVRGVALYKNCFKRHSIRACTYNWELFEVAQLQLAGGFYSVYMEDWLRIFHRDQMLVMRTEDYSGDIEGHMIRVFGFLGVAKLNKTQMDPVLTQRNANIGHYDKMGDMLPETIAILNEFYKPFVLRLHELLGGDDRFLWKDVVVK